MRVLITGGAGYIGGVTARWLLQAGHEPWVLDDLSRGHPAAVPAGAPLVRADLLDRAALRQALEGHPTDAVVHLAGLIEVGESVARPRDFYRVNVSGALALLDAVLDAGVPRFVFSSTAAVYASAADRQPLHEGSPLGPSNPYGDTKLAFERALAAAGRAYGLRYTVLRYFNAAGAALGWGECHEPESHLIPRVLRVAAGRAPSLTVFGTDHPTPDGTCVRDYVHVLDLARAHEAVLDAGTAEGRVYNVGTGVGHSVRQVIDAARRVTGRPIPVREGPRRPGDPPSLVAGVDRLRSELGFTCETPDLDTIVASAWAWEEPGRPARPPPP